MTATSAMLDEPTPRWDSLALGDATRTLIEASAGTGKTWTIAALYLRLIVERGLSAPQIVVTTFTNSAAQELRERLRQALIEAERRALSIAVADADPTRGAWLDARWQGDPGRRDRDIERLRVALAQLDVAPIGTLHQLCMRILADHPFACAAEFVLPPLVAGDAILDEITDDVWRIASQSPKDAPLAQMLAASGVADKRIELRKALGLLLRPGVVVAEGAAQIPTNAKAGASRVREIASREKIVLAESVKLQTAWLAFADWLDGAPDVSAGEFAATLQDVADDGCFHKRALSDPDLRAVRQFTIDLLPALNATRLRALAGVAALARERLQATLARRHQLRFDDLLERVAAALDRESGNATRPLADALHTAWPVALVDEFQDTDGVQFGILDAIYRDANGHARGHLVMIGDPKQAIYRFRGGDIDAYLRAAHEAQQKMTLDINYRAARALVAATNEFFEIAGAELSATPQAPIRYQPVAASARCDERPYTIAGAPAVRPLVVHVAEDEKTTAVPLRMRALTQCANQIVELLQSGEHRIGERAVTPADIAVLLPTANAIRKLRDLLRDRNVLCVTSDQTSVFRTHSARELQVVLHAVAQPGDVGTLRAAVATRLYGLGFADLQRLGDDVIAWQEFADQFHEWHVLWSARGVMAVVEQVIEHLAARYLATPLGERVITDLRHLGELLQARDDNAAGKEELLVWFGRQRSDAADDDGIEAADAAQLRIESDGDRVRIMTLHASKGLEFPIVLLPLMWDHNEFPAGRVFVVHASGRRTIDVSAAAAAEELAALQDERFRVLYVAMTRAIHACHVYAPPAQMITKAEGTKRSALNVMLERMQPALGAAALQGTTAHIEWIAGWRFGERQVLRAASAPGLPRRAAREFSARMPLPAEMKHSFTTLTRFAHARIDSDAAAADEIDIDALSAEAPMDAAADAAMSNADGSDRPAQGLARLAGVRGPDFGNAIHAIFEQRVAGESIAQQRDLVARCLAEHGVRRRDIAAEELVVAVAERLDGALAAPLGLDGARALRLLDVAAADLRAEMEFHFALDRVSMRRLREACARHGEPDLVPASHERLSGLMTGKIDLIFHRDGRFHVLDYKSNWLGAAVTDYADEALASAMDINHYRFQALIYSIATARYLRQRLDVEAAPLGECIYLFVRAAGLAPGAGIWRHRFADALLADVDGVIARAEAA